MYGVVSNFLQKLSTKPYHTNTPFKTPSRNNIYGHMSWGLAVWSYLPFASLPLIRFFFVHGKPLWLGYKMNYLWKTNKTSLDSGSSCSSLGLYLFTTYLSFLTVPCAFFSWSVSWWFLKWHVGRFFWAQHLLGMNVMSQISNKHHQRKAWCTPWFFNTSLKETFREGTLHTATSNKKYAPED